MSVTNIFPQSESMRWTFLSMAVVVVFFSAFALMSQTRPTPASQDV